MPMLDVWYAHLNLDDALAELGSQLTKKGRKRTEHTMAMARTRDSLQAFGKLTTMVDGRPQIISAPPLIVPVEELVGHMEADAVYKQLGQLLDDYELTLSDARRHLVQQFTLIQLARKVVGVGSVGTRAWVMLLEADDGQEPLFLQAKEAQESVLAGYAGPSQYTNQGERVVAGQHLMQAASDIFLGWQRTTGMDNLERDFYDRQLRDWKVSADIERMMPRGMVVYAGLCGWTLARAHARSGDRIAIAAYLGKSDTFDSAVADFAETYADQNELDHAALAAAVKDGRAQAEPGL
jgi:uncharacterized protein (DUF2252 family)